MCCLVFVRYLIISLGHWDHLFLNRQTRLESTAFLRLLSVLVEIPGPDPELLERNCCRFRKWIVQKQ